MSHFLIILVKWCLWNELSDYSIFDRFSYDEIFRISDFFTQTLIDFLKETFLDIFNHDENRKCLPIRRKIQYMFKVKAYQKWLIAFFGIV